MSRVVEPFNAEVIDTFCFHWPDMHSYVLVRVLEKTIAILPIRSRLAFLYFHHAPLPSHPSPAELRKTSGHQTKRLQYMFKHWKHTLILDEPSPTTPTDTPSSTPSNVTLSNVMSYEPSLKSGWIHAPCTVTDDVNVFDNTVVLTTRHTVLRLTCRCYSEKMMFMNLVKLKQQSLKLGEPVVPEEEEEEEEESTLSATQLVDHMLRGNQAQVERIQRLTEQMENSKGTISNCVKQLLDLERSLDILLESTTQITHLQAFERILAHVHQQVKECAGCFQSYKERMSALQERIFNHTGYLKQVEQRFDKLWRCDDGFAWRYLYD
ncbi:hypothetical protein INT47_001990 [Mucor saturninus]|uniref:Uncharacterized protein n=1 Tax=Mucor saturninus TaxID=64648 RepID=A0A8H7V4H7_9FUNG|nr:hypothetical protein INT47_001990 [Mucor saturninus]